MTIQNDKFEANVKKITEDYLKKVQKEHSSFQISTINSINGRIGASTQKYAKLEQEIKHLQSIKDSLQKEIKELESQIYYPPIKSETENDLLEQEQKERELQEMSLKLQQTKKQVKQPNKKDAIKKAISPQIDNKIITPKYKLQTASSKLKLPNEHQNFVKIVSHRVIEGSDLPPKNTYSQTASNIDANSNLDAILENNKLLLNQAKKKQLVNKILK